MSSMSLLTAQFIDFAGSANVVAMPRTTTPPKTLPNRLREIRKARGLSLEQLAELTGKSISSLQRWETGVYRLRVDDTRVLARALDCEPEEISALVAPVTVAVVGRVGAGARVFPIDDFAPGQGLYRVRCPSGMDPASTVAVEVVGSSMYPEIDEGWLLFYTRDHEHAVDEILGRRCVVKVAEDGPTLVKRVVRGPTAGRFNLLSANAPPMEDVALDWAAPVRAMICPKSAADAA